jgi:diguanylate cyclase (GGDEF)-like protein/PAS domain S-box-containing protein
MNSNNTIRLLILNNSRTEAERLISMLHNAGVPNRAQHVDSEDVLTKLLQEQTWDLLIAHDQTSNVTPQVALKHINRLNKDVPVLLLHDDESPSSVVEGMKAGAVDVVRLDDDQHLLLVIQRELTNREARQAKRVADRRFREAERRSQQLLDSSRDAIAYVQDGLYLYANESFAEIFGYEEKGDIECMPIMDMVDKKDQSTLKSFLKDFTYKGDDADLTKLEFTGVKHDGSPAQISLEVSHVTYDEEPCIQFLARARAGSAAINNNEALEAQIKQIKWQDVVTGFYNRQYMIDHLERVIDSIDDKTSLSLLYVDIDNFAERVQAALGVAGADMVLHNIAVFLRQASNEKDVLARFGDTAFTILISDINADAVVVRAQQLCKAIEDHIIDIEGKTLQVTASIGIALVNENSTSAGTVLEQALNAMEKMRAAGGNKAQLFEPEISNDKTDEKSVSAAIQHALDNDRFRLLFQPIISLRGSEEEYYEVYLRMVNEKGEDISPNRFLESAATIGACNKIDRWVILESIKMLSQHRSKGNKTKLIVNISRQSLCDDSLLPWLGVAFKAAKLPSDSIVFQVHEVDVTNHLNAAKAFAEGLAKLKTLLSISNFGCSLNPFNTIKHVPATLIKVDGSFTTDIQNNNANPETLINLIEQLHADNKITVVPFVENASVLSTLWQAGAHYIQGHYLQEPTQNMSYDFNMET